MKEENLRRLGLEIVINEFKTLNLTDKIALYRTETHKINLADPCLLGLRLDNDDSFVFKICQVSTFSWRESTLLLLTELQMIHTLVSLKCQLSALCDGRKLLAISNFVESIKFG